MSSPLYGAIEAGGTKFVCLLGTGPDQILARARFPTTDPRATLHAVTEFFSARHSTTEPAQAIGIASFGPVELRKNHPEYGQITRTPKPGWSGVDLAGTVASALSVPVGFDTDVNGAALGEGRWGAARGLTTYAYMTVGTGVGFGVVSDGSVLHGLVHSEAGHVTVNRVAGDEFAGSCPYHGSCLEGMASGPALAARFGKPGTDLTSDERQQAAALVAAYVADGIRNLIYVVAPERVIVGGGVADLPDLLPQLRDRLGQSLGGYPGLPEHEETGFLVPPALGSISGALGAFVLAEQALSPAT